MIREFTFNFEGGIYESQAKKTVSDNLWPLCADYPRNLRFNRRYLGHGRGDKMRNQWTDRIAYLENVLDAARFNVEERQRLINRLIDQKIELRGLLSKAQMTNADLLKRNLELEQTNNRQLQEICELTEALAKERSLNQK
jgi:hypothetical protein